MVSPGAGLTERGVHSAAEGTHAEEEIEGEEDDQARGLESVGTAHAECRRVNQLDGEEEFERLRRIYEQICGPEKKKQARKRKTVKRQPTK